MATAGVTTTGLAEMRAGLDRLPTQVSEALRAVAWRTSRRVREGAIRRLEQLTSGTGATAASIVVEEPRGATHFEVVVTGAKIYPANLPIWLEFGTVQMSARPFMRPARDAETDQYRRELEAAAVQAYRETVG